MISYSVYLRVRQIIQVTMNFGTVPTLQMIMTIPGTINEINVEVMVNAGENDVTHRVVVVLLPFSIFFWRIIAS